MTERHDAGYEASVDRELDLRGIALSGAGLALIVVLFAALMWWMSVGLRGAREAADPPPPALPEARIQDQPPEPRLQPAPEEDLRRMRTEEEALLHGYAWIDESAGVARLPIERAMEIVAERGVPEPAAGFAPPDAGADGGEPAPPGEESGEASGEESPSPEEPGS